MYVPEGTIKEIGLKIGRKGVTRSSMGNLYLTECCLAYRMHQGHSVENWGWF